MRVKGLEPPRHKRQNLNLVRLPIPPHPHVCCSAPNSGYSSASVAKDQTGCEWKIKFIKTTLLLEAEDYANHLRHQQTPLHNEAAKFAPSSFRLRQSKSVLKVRHHFYIMPNFSSNILKINRDLKFCAISYYTSERSN